MSITQRVPKQRHKIVNPQQKTVNSEPFQQNFERNKQNQQNSSNPVESGQNVPQAKIQEPSANPANSSPTPQPNAVNDEQIQAEKQKELDKAKELEMQVTAIKNAAQRYNEILAKFEFLPAQYQQIADDELDQATGAVFASPGSGGGKLRMPRTEAMEKKIKETSETLNDLYKKAMASSNGTVLYTKGPYATARNSNVRRDGTNVFDLAAKIVESFPYLLAR